YGDNDILGEATRINPGMSNVHTTVYIRRTFTTTPALDTNAHLFLTVDYDDGFVAYLDGAEIARRNVPGTPGTAVLHTASTGTSHEASCCNNPNLPVAIEAGSISNRLAPGEHVLAIIGVNADPPSSDFHLSPDLAVVATSSGPPSNVVDLGLYTLATTNIIHLTGSNTVADATRVSVNGDDAVVVLSNGTWSATRVLVPGMNQFYVAAL